MDIAILTSKTVNVLRALSDKPKTRKEIAKEVKLSTSSLSQAIKRFEQMGCLSERDGKLNLELKGRFILEMFKAVRGYDRLFSSINFNEYDFGDIPQHLVDRLHELSDVTVVEAFDRTIFKPHPLVVNDVLNAERVLGYSAMLYPEYGEVFMKVAEKGREVEAIVSKAVFNKIKEEFDTELRKFLSYDNVTLRVADNYTFSTILTSNSFFISFFFWNRTLDYTRFYAWKSRDALKWGEDLFEYIRENSYEVKLQSL